MSAGALDPLAEIGHLVDAVRRARDVVAADGAVDLAGLDTRVEALCNSISVEARVSDDAGRDAIAEAIRRLIASLEDLADDLSRQARQHASTAIDNGVEAGAAAPDAE